MPLVFFGKTTGRDLSVYMAEKFHFTGSMLRQKPRMEKQQIFPATGVSLPPLLRTVFAESWDLSAYQAHKIYPEPFPIFFAAETTHGKQDIFAAIAATLTNKMVPSNGTDPDFSRRPVDEHTAQDFAVKRA